MQRALAERGVPAVVGGGSSLLTSPAGGEWLALLEALEQPHRSGRVRAAALTSFVGRTLAELDAGGEALTDELADRLRGWALLLRGRGVAALLRGDRGARADRAGARRARRRAAADRPAPRRADAPRDGRPRPARSDRPARLAPRRSASRRRRSAYAVSTATRPRSRSRRCTRARDCSTRRLPALRLATSSCRDVTVALYHDDDGTRMLDVSGSGAAVARPCRGPPARGGGRGAAATSTSRSPGRQSQVVTWWAPTYNTPGGGLHRLLLRAPAGPGRGARQSGRARRRLRLPRTGHARRAGWAGARGLGGARGHERRHRPCRPADDRPSFRPRGRHRVAPYVVLRADPGAGAARRRDLRARARPVGSDGVGCR